MKTQIVWLAIWFAFDYGVVVEGLVDRNNAFIGYNEQVQRADVELHCADKEKQCKQWADDHQCFKNPFFMRVSCPRSCEAAKACGVENFRVTSLDRSLRHRRTLFLSCWVAPDRQRPL
jgi:ShK domain-like